MGPSASTASEYEGRKLKCARDSVRRLLNDAQDSVALEEPARRWAGSSAARSKGRARIESVTRSKARVDAVLCCSRSALFVSSLVSRGVAFRWRETHVVGPRAGLPEV